MARYRKGLGGKSLRPRNDTGQTNESSWPRQVTSQLTRRRWEPRFKKPWDKEIAMIGIAVQKNE